MDELVYLSLIYFVCTDESIEPLMSIETILKGVIVFVIMLSIICTAYYFARKHFASNLKPETLYLVDFMNGHPESINPELRLDEQAHWLPYNMKYEFDRNKIEIGEQIGEGAFGMVLKGTAHGILENEERTKVAIKMVKSSFDYEVNVISLPHLNI